MKRTDHINQILNEYFEHNKSAAKIHAKDMMSYFILAGIFKKDVKNGLPIRTLLNKLQEKNQISLIPFAFSEKINKYSHWYFKKVKYKGIIVQPTQKVPKKKATNNLHLKNIKKICDAALGSKGKMNYVFDSKPYLIVDLFYVKFNLVIEFIPLKKVKTTKLKSQKLHNYLTQKGIRWVQIPEDISENKEAQAESIKNHLNFHILL